jgi:membrane fusion protein (multidrug efflux system)
MERSTPPQEPPERESLFKKHPRAKYILAVVALLVLAGGLLYWLHARVRENTDDAQIEGNITPVASRVSGAVTKVNVDDNQLVNAGDVLVQLDPRDYQVAVERAQGELADALANARGEKTAVPVSSASSTSQLAIARANIAAAQQEVDAAKARLEEATANYNKAATDLKRFQQLLQKDEISRQQYDAAVANDKSAQATVDAARAAVATAQSHVEQARAQFKSAATAPEQISIQRSKAAAAEGNVQTKQAALAQAKLNLEYTVIRAPVAGVVSKKSVQPGQTMQAGQPLLALVPLDDIWVVANYKENQLRNMRVGQKATIHVDAYDRDYNGHVESVGGTTAAKTSLLPPENATGNYVKVVQRVPVKIVFDKGQDPNHLLRPGMSVLPTVLTK